MKRMVNWRSSAIAAAIAASAAAAPAAHAQAKEIVFGAQCDFTGATAVVGTGTCAGIRDYVDLVNSKGGVDGYTIKLITNDNAYKVPAGVEAYQHQKQDGAITMAIYGTPIVQALAQNCDTDHISCTTPGFGIGASADGTRYPYVFPIAASYWSQAAAAVQFAQKQLGGNLKGKKIAYIFYDNPAGREPLPVLQDLAAKQGFELKTFAVPPPGLDVSAQTLDIAGQFHADFVIAHVFGRSPGLTIKGLKANGFPLNHMIGLVWAASESDVESGGGKAADGYNAMEFAGVGNDYPVSKEIIAMYAKAGKPPPKEMQVSVYYNRGVAWAALHLQAIHLAIAAKGGAAPTGEDVKNGFEHIHDFTLGGLVAPLTITPKDHEGGGLVQVWQVKGGKLTRETDWFRAFPEEVEKQVEANAK